MGLANCPECGKLYVQNSSGLCPVCAELEEEAEQKVAEYLRNTGKASVEEIHEATGIKEKTILRMIKRGRIFSDVQISYPCESCGQQIYEGRLCEACSRNITSQIKHEEWKAPERKESKRQSDGMYTNRLENK